MKYFNKVSAFLSKPGNIIWLVFALFSLFTLFTIKIYRLPWYDEAFLADVSMNYHKEGLIMRYINDPFAMNEELAWGPVYFMINSWIIKLFGFGIWQMRIVNLLLGLMVLYLTIRMLQKLNISANLIIWGLLLVISDAELSFSLHSGRMDMVAFFFLFLAVYIYFFSTIRRWPRFLLCGVLIALGALTSTRINTLLPLLVIFPLVGKDWKAMKSIFVNLVITFIGFISIYSIWIFSKFDGIYAYFEYFISYGSRHPYYGKGALFNGSIIERFFRSPRYIPIFILFYISVFLYLKYEYKKSSSVIFFLILMYFSFIIINGWGYYYLILPIVYIVVLFAYHNIIYKWKVQNVMKFSFKWMLIAIFILNISFLSYHLLKIYVTYNDYSNSNMQETIASKIKPDSKVLADYRYYYICKKLNCQFVGITYKNVSIEQYSPDYIITKNLNFSHPGYKYIGDLDYERWQPSSSIKIIDKALKSISKRKKYSSNAFIFVKQNKESY